ncbi:MAG TPA: hypothetical protein VFV34_24565 [Blastocatellia bacterium]|nr:hypothetical protein [Blastocatellia bacterium]
MKKHRLLTVSAASGLLAVMVSLQVREACAGAFQAQDSVPPAVFQAAGPTAASIQDSVDAYRAALGAPNNGNLPGPLATGRREINWDGGNVNNQTTVISANPFDGFKVTRGALFTTPDGTGFVQAPPAADPVLFPPGGLAGVFNNPTYGTIFSAFSASRLFSAIGSNVTEVDFFVPGGGNIQATVKGFGAVFTDVDQPDGGGSGKKHSASTLIEYFDAKGGLLFSSFVPASPGDGSISFFGIVFEDARIARVRITSGRVAPGPDDGGKRDVVMMDDFIYDEPQRLP